MATLLYMSGSGGIRLPTSGLTRYKWKSKPSAFSGRNTYVPNFMLHTPFVDSKHDAGSYKVLCELTS